MRHPGLGEAASRRRPIRAAMTLPGRGGRAAGARGRRLARLLRRAAQSHRATFPSRADDYGPIIRPKLERAVDTTPEALAAARDAVEAWKAAAREDAGGRRDRLAGARAAGPAANETPEHEFRIPFSAYARVYNFLGWPAIAIGETPARRPRPADAARSGARVGSVGATGSLRRMVEGPAVTLDDDHAPAVRIDALEMFVDLLARVEEDGSSDAFYGRLCEAACSLTSMDRAVIFRYDEAQRRVRAAGTHNLPLELFAGAHFTVESAAIARQALEEDRVLDVPESSGLELPEAYRDLLRDGLLVCTPIAASGRWTGVILSDRAGTDRARRTPSATCCGRSARSPRSRRTRASPRATRSSPTSCRSASTSRARSTTA